MSLSQFADRHHDNDTPLHSNAYAKVAHGDKIGSTNAQSFNERLMFERNRQTVRRYGDSLIGSGYMKENVRPRLNTHSPLRTSESATPRSRQQADARSSAVPPRTFTEPPSRRYNPYS